MAAHSKHSETKGKRSTKQTEKPTTPEEAAELLTSALDYCRKAGLIVEGYNESDGLALFIRGAKYENEVVTPIGVTLV